jgi:hypothetical protein
MYARDGIIGVTVVAMVVVVRARNIGESVRSRRRGGTGEEGVTLPL